MNNRKDSLKSDFFYMCSAQNQKRWAQHFFLMPHLTSIDKHMTSTTANEELDNLITTRWLHTSSAYSGRETSCEIHHFTSFIQINTYCIFGYY